MLSPFAHILKLRSELEKERKEKELAKEELKKERKEKEEVKKELEATKQLLSRRRAADEIKGEYMEEEEVKVKTEEEFEDQFKDEAKNNNQLNFEDLRSRSTDVIKGEEDVNAKTEEFDDIKGAFNKEEVEDGLKKEKEEDEIKVEEHVDVKTESTTEEKPNEVKGEYMEEEDVKLKKEADENIE